ncbi:MAG: hypothetical protein ABR915_05910 [Thermoguttaceae bacterium]
MNRYLFGLIGIALLGASPLLGQTATCGGEGACSTGSGCNACCDCCPHCGCKLVPQCHIYCTTKKVTEYKYTCCCEDKCLLCPSCRCSKCCDNCAGSGGCATGGDTSNNGCQECCGKCKVCEVKKLIKCPCVKEVPVRQCTVEWVCPKCGNCGEGGSTSAPAAAPSAPAPGLPPPPKSTGLAPRLSGSGLVQLP